MTEHIDFRAYRGVDCVFLAWWHPTKIDGCLGFSVSRRVGGGAAAPLEAYVGFPTEQLLQSNPEGEPSTKWPFQRFTWTDFSPPAEGNVEYQVTAMSGSPTSPAPSLITSDWVAPTQPQPEVYLPFFNFGIVGSRWFALKAEEYPNEFEALRKALVPSHAEEGNSDAADVALEAVLRLPMTKGGPASPTIGDELGGPLAKKVKVLLDEAIADPKIEVYLALFELSDSDLIGKLGNLGRRCHLILANGTHSKGVDENTSAASALGDKVDLSRRIIKPASVYAHNKFMVFVREGKPAQAWTGSLNWSPHGLYTQVNNGLYIDDPDVAQAYCDEWHRLQKAGDVTPPPQTEPPTLEQFHFERKGVSTSLFFSPHHLPKADGANSPDLKYASSLVRGARHGILTLMLDPGWQGSLLQAIREQAQADPALYIRGVVNTDPTIHSQQGDPTVVGFLHDTEAVPSNYDIVLPSAQRQAGAPITDYLSRVGIVVVHSKVIVIDPLGDHPVVMTGSHNDGVKAATVNDDNLIIVENDRELAIAYAINVMSVFTHFWWRHNMAPAPVRANAKAAGAQIGGPAHLTSAHEWTGLRPNDAWQDKFFGNDGNSSEALFWGVKS